MLLLRNTRVYYPRSFAASSTLQQAAPRQQRLSCCTTNTPLLNTAHCRRPCTLHLRATASVLSLRLIGKDHYGTCIVQQYPLVLTLQACANADAWRPLLTAGDYCAKATV